MPTRSLNDRPPFYINAPEYDDNGTFAVQLHELCSRLNHAGHEAYVVGCTRLNGQLWTPLLTREVQAAHYLAGRVPVSITPTGVGPRGGVIGLAGEYVHEGPGTAGSTWVDGHVAWPALAAQEPPCSPLRLPLADPTVFSPPLERPEDAAPLVYAELLHKAGGTLRTSHTAFKDISPARAGRLSATERATLFQQASCLLAYEAGPITAQARLCGCPVIYIASDYGLKTAPTSQWDMLGAAWNDELADLTALRAQTAAFSSLHGAKVAHTAADIEALVNTAVALSRDMTFEDAWPAPVIDAIQDLVIPRQDRARLADQARYRQLAAQYKTWRTRSSLREIDGQIYAEHIVAGQLSPFGVLIDGTHSDMESVARTLDSLGSNFLQPAAVGVMAGFDCPVPVSELGPQFSWFHHDGPSDARPVPAVDAWPAWTLVIEAGAELEPHALVEFALAARADGVKLIYCDEDSPGPGGQRLPHFKPDLNVEWLRCTNYLGSAVAVRSAPWLAHTTAAQAGIEGLYGLALQWSTRDQPSIAHIDTVLVHTDGNIPADREAHEIDCVQQTLKAQGLKTTVQPGKTLGAWQLEYHSPTARSVSVIIPTGYQLGYLQCLLQSMRSYPDAQVSEAILVVQPANIDATQRLLSDIDTPMPVRVISANGDGAYNHAAALNAGAAAATGELLLVLDDDTEWIQDHWLSTLTAYFDQPDIGCVAPRLVLHVGDNAMLQSGPLTPNITSLLMPYLGERQLLDEQGVFSRLQTSQDVMAVSGNCFVLRKSLWTELNGFDEEKLNLLSPVQDFCLRALPLGLRHVWTPVSNVLHHGGKTVAALQREPAYAVQWQAALLNERQALLERWGEAITSNGLYNRHLSLLKPHDIETDIVIDWNPRRADRPRVLALPISSGSGQYRVIEPLNALQRMGLAQTCAVIPDRSKGLRSPSPLELQRIKPDRLIVQHSISDMHYRLLREYRQVLPDLFIIQMVDDLFRNLPETHPHYRFHQREGEVRMRDAVSMCNRLIVSTQPLADAYQQYCPDVVVMPNCLNDEAWGAFFHEPPVRNRLRIGWAGAAQHLGDLNMIEDVVAALAPDVDWVFMGMCPNSLRPYVHEFHPFVSYAEYPAKLAMLDLDIAIAPLEDNTFNESKSNLRLLEYGAMGWPVVCSDVYPFRSDDPPVVRLGNQSTDWIAALRQLMASRAERRRLGTQLHDWVEQRYFISKRTDAWMQAIFAGKP